MQPYISYSELKDWKFCANYHKLTVHSVCDRKMLNEQFDDNGYFLSEFEKNLSELDKDTETDPKLIEQMRIAGVRLNPHIIPAVEEKFGKYEVISTEEKLMVPINGTDYNFKGYVDLVIKTEDGKYHVIDWKTCSWGWGMRKRTDPMVTYQLTLYKRFFALKHGIDPSNIMTHFALLKRTAKKDFVEFVDVSSGERKKLSKISYLARIASFIRLFTAHRGNK